MTLEEAIRDQALALGFDGCRFTTAAPPATAPRFQEWLQAQCHGQMAWMTRSASPRTDPQRVLPGVQSIVMLAAAYDTVPTPTLLAAGSPGSIAFYARQRDYHEVLGEKLKALASFIDHHGGAGTRSVCYTDTGPVLERDLAERAGLGFIGKHTNLISRTHGNWHLLGEILTTVRLEADRPEKNRCGTCTRCLAACPTQAITSPFRLDARRCISYLTIELKGSIPLPFRPLIGNRIFGCDDCLAVCPWNRFARGGALMRQHARPDLGTPDLLELLALDEPAFKARFAGTPILRTKRRGLLRNVCVALGNTGSPGALPALQKAAADPEPLVAEHAAWALEQLRTRTGATPPDAG
jgi:epoxyqueuosine reductase